MQIVSINKIYYFTLNDSITFTFTEQSTGESTATAQASDNNDGECYVSFCLTSLRTALVALLAPGITCAGFEMCRPWKTLFLVYWHKYSSLVVTYQSGKLSSGILTICHLRCGRWSSYFWHCNRYTCSVRSAHILHRSRRTWDSVPVPFLSVHYLLIFPVH